MRTSLSTAKTNSRRGSNTRRRIIAIVALGIVAIALLSFSSVRNVTPFLYVVEPVHSGVSFVARAGYVFLGYLKGKQDVLDERDRLRDELSKANADMEAIAESSEGNKKLKALLLDAENEQILAGVLIHPNHTPYDTLVIDKGKQDGVEDGAVVYLEGNKAVGVILRAGEWSSVVALFSTPGIETTVYVFGPDIAARTVGLGNGVMQIRVPQGLPLEEGDTVVYPTLSSNSIGVITRVESKPTEPDQYGYLALPESVSSMRYVKIAPHRFLPPSAEEIHNMLRTASTSIAHYFDLPPGINVATTTATTSAE